MSLSFDAASTDIVVIPADASIDDLGTWTIMSWYNVAATANFDVLVQKPDNVGSGNRAIFMFSGEWFVRQHQSTTRADYNGHTIATNTWEFFAATYDEGATPRITGMEGTLDSVATAVSWTTSSDGSGTATADNADDFNIGNYASGSSSAGDIDIAWVGMWNRVLTQGEIKAQQFHPHVTSGCVGFWHCGWNGTGSVIDLSGNQNNSSSTTGVTVAAHVPLRPLYGVDTISRYAVSFDPSTDHSWSVDRPNPVIRGPEVVSY